MQQTFDFKKGLIDRKIFYENDIYQQELDKIFARCWLYLGHETQVANPGDFITTFMGEDPVIVSRSNDGQIYAFLNSCSHRGMRLCKADMGNANYFKCPNHGWTFRNNGTLAGVPNYVNSYYKELEFNQWGLKSVAKIELYRGFIFATFSKDAPTPC